MSEKKIKLAGVWVKTGERKPDQRHGGTYRDVVMRHLDNGRWLFDVCDVGDLADETYCEWEWLDTTPEAMQQDNDGTVTLYGVPVTVHRMPTGYRLAKVFVYAEVGFEFDSELRPAQGLFERITQPTPPSSWQPPASLPDGFYSSRRDVFQRLHFGPNQDRKNWWGIVIDTTNYRDFLQPDFGYWRVKDGTAKYLGKEWEGGVE